MLVSTSGVDSIQLWSLATISVTKTIESTDGYVWKLASDRQGKYLASAVNAFDKPSRIVFRDSATGTIHKSIDTPHASISCIAFSPDGTLLATAGFDERKGTQRRGFSQ